VIAWECDSEWRCTWAYSGQRSDSAAPHVGELLKDEAGIQAVTRTRATGEIENFQTAVTLEDQQRYFMSSVRAEVGPDGKTARMIGASVDVTELALVQAELRREAQRKDAGLAILAHERCNPMASIRHAAAMLGKELTSAEREEAGGGHRQAGCPHESSAG